MVNTIFIVRHAESESNAKRYYGGWTDSPLTELGLKQAESLKKRFDHEEIGRVFCSDSKRARDTLKLLDLNCPVEFAPELRERYYGSLEGKYYDDDPQAKRHHADPLAKAPGNGESAQQVQRRVWNYFQEKIFTAKEESILVLTHHGPIVTFACKFLQMPLRRWRAFKVGNASVSILIKEEGLWRITLWNSLSSLGLKSYGPLLEQE
ncbi:hypothetical protein DRN67_02260 [Candidatus Micrarchaeota archaeon]|mgnify:CR=1 FL=1|nr:MAG: hypothetical protein DRN67_02260 [Candidatus Micrarchaeota archaeon]